MNDLPILRTGGTTGGDEPEITDRSEQGWMATRESTDQKVGGSSPSERAAYPQVKGYILRCDRWPSRLSRPCLSQELIDLPNRSCCARSPKDGRRVTLPGFLVILLTMTVLPLGDVKSHLSELVGRVHDHHERVTVTVHGRPSAILIAPEDLGALEETLEIMRDASAMNRLAESDAELARGEYVSAEELAEAMRRRQAQ
jgi:antitoxin YefM